MSGASRAEKRRKQQEAERRLTAAGIQAPKTKTNRTAQGVVAAVLVVAVVIAAGVWFANRSGHVEPTYTATASGAVVTAGNGPVVIDVYEDYLCPSCERFEERYGDDIVTALNDGRITVRFHTIAILDKLSEPAGYSTRAATAALCAAPAGIYPKYHQTLFDEQPAENSAGLADDQLVAFGADLGAPGDFAQCVTSDTHTDEVTAETQKAIKDPSLQSPGSDGQPAFGTPTVAIDGKKIDLNDTSWLQNAIG